MLKQLKFHVKAILGLPLTFGRNLMGRGIEQTEPNVFDEEA